MSKKLSLKELTADEKKLRKKNQIAQWKEQHPDRVKEHSEKCYYKKKKDKVSKGKVYKIVSKKNKDLFYVGSTFGSLDQRFKRHIGACKKLKGKLYTELGANPDDYDIVLIEEIQCKADERQKLRDKEEEFRKKLLPTLNTNVCSTYLTFDVKDIQSYQSAYQPAYYDKNKERIAARNKAKRDLKNKLKDDNGLAIDIFANAP